MYLNKVTITGADDSTGILQLVELSEEFPFVEWGILVSRRQEGSYRFPSREWMDRLAAVSGRLQLSMHICGAWVRQMFVGELDWTDLPVLLQNCQRIQINTHAERHASTVALLPQLDTHKDKQIIFQWDGVNDHLTYVALAHGLNVAALFDTSGGAGILPKEWPAQTGKFPCGYAGGLGPGNVVENIRKIESLCSAPYWIDMERRVRTHDDSALNMDSVKEVLRLARKCLNASEVVAG
jgi:hypothetical protein